MKLSDYLDIERGRGVAVAQLVGVAPQQIYQWASGSRPIPADKCPDIELATGGEVRCEDLRPDVNWSVVRENSKAPHNRRKEDKAKA